MDHWWSGVSEITLIEYFQLKKKLKQIFLWRNSVFCHKIMCFKFFCVGSSKNPEIIRYNTLNELKNSVNLTKNSLNTHKIIVEYLMFNHENYSFFNHEKQYRSIECRSHSLYFF